MSRPLAVEVLKWQFSAPGRLCQDEKGAQSPAALFLKTSRPLSPSAEDLIGACFQGFMRLSTVAVDKALEIVCERGESALGSMQITI
ncbi:hypothetical protein [Trichloromonas sp.]|uniref:hypothetical protein n=1 Tax=Trichloromonas sp. TaxID=3069249 RepID=UPI002A49A6F6|nr:hypothetical protein [Trichloromonas sp.]